MSNLYSASDLTNNSTRIISNSQTKQFLKFAIYPRTQLMLPLEQITEVLKIKFGQIVPIPQMPSWVMGVYNWRGDILWMVDLGHAIGLEPWYQGENYRSNKTAIVLSPDREKGQSHRETGITLGLVVSQVEDIKMCDLSAIQSPPSNSVSPELSPFLQGYCLGEEENMIMVLDGKAIVAAMPQNLSSE